MPATAVYLAASAVARKPGDRLRVPTYPNDRTPADIASGRAGLVGCCPVARTIRRVLGDHAEVFADRIVVYEMGHRAKPAVISTEFGARRRVEEFDRLASDRGMVVYVRRDDNVRVR